MKVDTDLVHSAVRKLSESSSILFGLGLLRSLGGSIEFSSVPGLNEAGSYHASARLVGEPEATRCLAMHLSNTSELLKSQITAYSTQDIMNGLSLPTPNEISAYFDETAKSLGDGVAIVHPAVSPIGDMPLVAGRMPSLEELLGALATTNIDAMKSVSSSWGDSSSAVAEALTMAPSAFFDLESSAETESIQRAMGQISRIDKTAAVYVGRADAMAVHTGALATIAESSLWEAAIMSMAVRTQATTNPAVAKTMEEAYLTQFGPRLVSQLIAAKPPFNELLVPLDSPNGAGIDVLGPKAAGTAEFPKVALPKPIQNALEQAGYGDLAHAQTPTEVIEQFGRPNPDMLERIAAGATQTQAASAAAPSLPPIAGGGPSFAGTTPAFAGTGAGFTGAPTAGGVTPFGAGTPSAGTPGAGAPGVGGVGGFASPFGAGVGAGAAGAGALRAGAGAGGGGLDRSAAVPGSGLRGGRGGGVGGVGGLGGVGSGGTGGSGSGATGGVAPGVGSPGVGTPSAGATNVVAGNPGGAGAHGSRGGVVGGPAAAGNGGRGRSSGKKGKVQAVTSAVEREGNLKALLGEAPEVVPGVIGSWVRQPRT